MVSRESTQADQLTALLCERAGLYKAVRDHGPELATAAKAANNFRERLGTALRLEDRPAHAFVIVLEDASPEQ